MRLLVPTPRRSDRLATAKPANSFTSAGNESRAARTIATRLALLVSSLVFFCQPAFAAWDHILLIVMENAGYDAIIGNTADAPYINRKLLPQGVLYSRSYAVAHPSLPNYLALFSGDIQ